MVKLMNQNRYFFRIKKEVITSKLIFFIFSTKKLTTKKFSPTKKTDKKNPMSPEELDIKASTFSFWSSTPVSVRSDAFL